MTPEEKLDVVLSRLKGVRKGTNGQYHARCPAHDDRNPSFGIALGEKWVLVNCLAGCPVDKVLAALDLTWKDLVFEDADRPKPKRRTERELELTAMACVLRLQNEPEVLRKLRYGRGWAARALELLNVGWDGARLTLPVRTAEGKLHDVLRYDAFAGAKEPDGASSGSLAPADAWMADWGGAKPKPPARKIIAGHGRSRLPWPAPESIDADTILLVEGEGTVISLMSIGIHAVALPGALSLATNIASPGSWQGAGWHKAWARRFERFRYIVCVPDCDGPGRALMGAARYDLEKAGRNVRILDLGPKRWDGYDIGDFLRSAYDGPSRRAAKELVREMIATETEVLLAA